MSAFAIRPSFVLFDLLIQYNEIYISRDIAKYTFLIILKHKLVATFGRIRRSKL